MLSLIRSMFETPESQKDPHYWAATLAGHAWIGLFLWGLVAIATDKTTATYVVPIAYVLLWEAPQFYFARRRNKELAWDCVLDATAVALACFMAYSSGITNMYVPFWACIAVMCIIYVGSKVRE